MATWSFRSARKVDSPMTARWLKRFAAVRSVSKPGGASRFDVEVPPSQLLGARIQLALAK